MSKELILIIHHVSKVYSDYKVFGFNSLTWLDVYKIFTDGPNFALF